MHIVAERYCSPHPVELTVSKKVMSLSGESFTIKDPQENIVFKMDGHALSIRDRCTLLDADGQPILSARKKMLSAHERWEVFRGEDCHDDNKLFWVKKTSVVQFKTHLEVFLGGADADNDADFTVKGNFFEREAQICRGDHVVAEIKRKYTVGNVLLDKHTFVVCIQPHVDQAFIATLVIIMDRIHED